MAADDVEGARVVVDAGDVGVWLSCFIVRRLLWSVGGQGCSWWWVLPVSDVVAVVEVGGCGMKKEAASLFVTGVTFGSTSQRARAIALGSRSRPNLKWTQFCRVCYTICSVQYTIV